MQPVTTEDKVITKIIAAPMPAAVLTFLDTPKKGHKPKNWLKTTLLIREELTRITSKSFIVAIYFSSFCSFSSTVRSPQPATSQFKQS